MFEKLKKVEKLQKAKKHFLDAVSKDSTWQGDAKKAFNFRDGIGQWTKEELQIMEEELRPALTFNLTKSSVDLIMGMNEENKIRYRVSPTEPTDAFLSEVLNDVADWAYENWEFEDEEVDALESAAICGRGYLAIDFLPDPKRFGEIIMSLVSVPVHEIHFDPAARRRNLDDASYICWDRWMPVEEFKMKYPQIEGETLKEIVEFARSWGLEGTDETGMTPVDPFEIPVDVDADDSDYDAPLDLSYYDKSKQMVRVIHMEYWESFDRYYVWNPEGRVFEEALEKPNSKVKKMYQEEFGEPMTIEVIRDKKVKWIHFTGDHILYDDNSPIPFDGFSIVPMFAFTDVSKRSMNHFGIVRGMIDPQREVNKRWSQTLNMLNNQVQPGIFAEIDAFVDEAQAMQSMKEAGGITYLNAGALTSGKIQERNLPSFPNAPMQIEQHAQDIIRKITGINPDLLGQDRGRQEPGVVIRLRQQQGMTLLKPLFRSFNNMKKGIFKRMIACISEYMPDEQILRILGQNDRYSVDKQTGIIIDNIIGLQAELRNVRDLEYNLKSEESPGNMSKRTLELQAYMEMMQTGFPVDPNQILEKLELPESEKIRWMEYIKQQNEAAAQQQQQAMELEASFKDRELSVKESQNQLDMILGMAKIDQMEAKDDKKLAMDIARLDHEKRKSIAEFAIQLIQALNQARIEETKIQAEEEKVRQQVAANTGEELKLVQQGVGLASDIIKVEADTAKLENELKKMKAERAQMAAELDHEKEQMALDRKRANMETRATEKKLEFDEKKMKLDIKKAKAAAEKPKGENK
jgi:hypothetical protein